MSMRLAGPDAISSSPKNETRNRRRENHVSNRFSNPKTMPAPRGYTQVVETTGPGRTVYLSGQLGMTPGGAFAGPPGISARRRRSVSRISRPGSLRSEEASSMW
jgi:enamine deaminase RidA (YjgF/YER057c/UK114 family)